MTPGWKTYERWIAALAREEAGVDLGVTANAKLRGRSGEVRQVDVLVEARWHPTTATRLIIDGKRYESSRVDIKEVEAFLGMMEDCSAARGMLICPSGYTRGAKASAASNLDLRVLTVEEAERHAALLGGFELCFGACMERPSGRGIVLWEHGAFVGGMDSAVTIAATGKCDGCHNFHIECQGCGRRLAVQDGSGESCLCEIEWRAVVERDATAGVKAVVLAARLEGQWYPLDRRVSA